MDDIQYISTFHVYDPTNMGIGTPMLIDLASNYIRAHGDDVTPIEDFYWDTTTKEMYGVLFTYFDPIPIRSDVECFFEKSNNYLGLTTGILVKGSIVAARFESHDEPFTVELYQFRFSSKEKIHTGCGGPRLSGSQKWYYTPRQ